MITVKKFGAVWCGPCRALAPVLEGMKKEYEGKETFVEYDVDNSPEETQQYNVTSVPVVIIEKDGEVAHRFTGLQAKLTYTNAINEAIKLVLVDRLEEVATKTCYICSGFGHAAQVCPTAPTVRGIATLTGLPKLKRCINASIDK